MTRAQEVAKIILQQMGGNKLIAMTGAKNFVAVNEQEGGLFFALPKFPGVKINRVKIVLTPADTYTMEFFASRGTTMTSIAKVEDVYCDQLCATFEEATGLATSLFGETNRFG